MFRGGAFFTIFLLYSTTFAALVEPPIFHKFVKHNLMYSPIDQPVDSILAQLKQDYPKLRIIVLRQNSPQFSKEQTVQFVDPNVSISDYQYYFDHSQFNIQSVAYYLAPQALLSNDTNRPLLENPLIVLRQNAPLHAVFHELAHFFMDEAFRNGETKIPENEALLELTQKSGEEVFVDFKLLENRALFSFDQNAICARHKYLHQNLQVFKFFINEMFKLKDEFSEKDLEIFKELQNLYSDAYKEKMKDHSDCIFWKPKA